MFLTQNDLKLLLHSIENKTTTMDENIDNWSFIYNELLTKLDEYSEKEAKEYNLNDLKCGCVEASKLYFHLKDRNFFTNLFLNLKNEEIKDLFWKVLTDSENNLRNYHTIILDNSNSNLGNILNTMSCKGVEFYYKTFDELVFTSKDFEEVYESYNLDI